MSNFQSLDLVTETLIGSAPSLFSGVTTDSLATIMAAGYLNDIAKKIKANDQFNVNYLDNSSFPLSTGESSVYQEFSVQYDPTLGNWNLIPSAAPQSAIAALGVHSVNYSNAGGSATTVITDPAITPNSVVLARWRSSTNSVIIKTVLPGNGTLTIVSTGDPGASTLDYIDILPSVALQNAGVYAAQYSNAGGSATITIANANLTAAMIANANFVSQANAVEIKTVIAGAGTLTIVCTGDPGVSVLAYTAMTVSSALTTAGLYGAAYTNAGGSATTTITDANITAMSIVIADWASQANAVEIYKVTPTASTLTILSSGDPGASVLNYIATPTQEGALVGTYLLAANNLSDVQSTATSRTNLGLGTTQSVVFGNVQAGASGLAGDFVSYPATASNGSFIFQAANNSGGFNSTLRNGNIAQATVYSLPDTTSATANVLAAGSALVSGNLVQASGTGGAVVDSAITAASVSGAITQLGKLYNVSVTLNTSQMAAAYATPAQLIANPLASQMILVLAAQVYTASTGNTAYATGTAPIIQYSSGGTNGAHGAGTIATAAGLVAGDITAATSQVRNLLQFATGAQTGLSGLGVYFSNATGAYTAGTGTNVTFTLTYILLTATV